MDEHPDLSPYANVAELEYREHVQPQHDTPETFVAKIRASGRLALLPYLQQRGVLRPAGDVLEIGAGSGWLTAELSKLPSVRSVTAVDFSDWLVSRVMPGVFALLDADVAKITRRRGDFHDLRPLGAARFDYVFADSALHHATDVSVVLREAARVLQPGGALVALREPVAPILSSRLRRLRAETEQALKEHGVEEPLYSRAEWSRFFREAGLRLEWHDVVLSRGIRGAAAKLLNGISKADYCLVGRPASR